MSDIVVEPRRKATRARALGDAVPLRLTPLVDDGPKVEPKTSAELRAESEARRDAQPMSTRCAVDGCGWTITATAGECRDEAAAHRQAAHPELVGRRTERKQSVGKIGGKVDDDIIEAARRRRTEREQAEQLATIERGRARRGELLEEVDAERLGPDGATSSSSTLDDLAEVEPEPEAGTTRRFDPAVLVADAPTAPGDRPSGSTAASTTYQEGLDVERKRTYERWSREKLIDRLREAARELGHTPTVNELRKLGLHALANRKMYGRHGFDSYHDIVRAADLELPAAHARTGAATRAAAKRASTPPQPQPASTPIPVEENALRDPLPTASIPYDADRLTDEAEFLRRRADALEQIAVGLRQLAVPREQAA